MSRTLKGLPVAPDPTSFSKTLHYDVMKDAIDLLLLGGAGRNQRWGGNDNVGLISSTVIDVVDQGDGFEIDNSANQISAAAGVVVQVRIRLRVENAAVSVTPRIYNVTDSGVATTTGAAACSATNEDFSGTDQQQTLTLTLATGLKKYKAQVTPSAATYQVFASGVQSDIYIPS